MINKQLLDSVQKYIDTYLEQQDFVCDKLCDIICYPSGSNKIYPDLLENLEPTFSQKVFNYIREKGYKETDVYKNANIDRKLFSKIRSNDNYKPTKNTVFALIIGLKLDLDEAEDLLDSAGYSLSHSIKKDLIIEFAIKNHITDIITVNELLDRFDCKIL